MLRPSQPLLSNFFKFVLDAIYHCVRARACYHTNGGRSGENEEESVFPLWDPGIVLRSSSLYVSKRVLTEPRCWSLTCNFYETFILSVRSCYATESHNLLL